MGVLDMLNLFVFCMINGVLGMLGSVYCSAPDFLYVKGAAAMGNFSVLLKQNREEEETMNEASSLSK